MASSDARKPNYSRRFFWWAVFIVVLFGGYSAGWYYFAGRLQAEVAGAVGALNGNGRTADCANPQVNGFPFRIGVFCDAVAYEDGRRGVYARAGNFRSLAQIYQPTRAIAELDGPLEVGAPGLSPLAFDWDGLRASVSMGMPIPRLVSVVAEDLSGRTNPAAGDAMPLFRAEHAEGHLRPNGEDVDWAGSFRALQVDPAAADGRSLPPLDGSVDATIVDGLDLFRSDLRSLRGRSAEIRSLALSTGDGGVTLAGPVSVDANGLVNAEFTVTIRNPKSVATALAETFPEQRKQIEQGLVGLSFLGTETAMPLKIVQGQASLGFIPLGRVPAVE